MRMEEKEDGKSTEALKEAIMEFPMVVPVLADKADIELPDGCRSHPAFQLYTDSRFLSLSLL